MCCHSSKPPVSPTGAGSGPSGSGGATCADGSSPPCPKCCCCATNGTIQNVAAYNRGSTFGHDFDFVIDMSFAGGSAGSSDCSLEWWERMDLPNFTGAAPNTWTDQFSNYPGSPTFDPWKNRTIPCPGGGSLNV